MAQTSRGLLERVRENEAADGRVVEPGGPISDDRESPASPHLTVLDSGTPGPIVETVAGAGQPLPPHLLAIKRTVHTRLLGRYAIEIDPSRRQEIREKILTLLDEHLRESGMGLTRGERDRLVGALLDDICGLGPLQVLMDDPDVTEVMINHPSQVYV